VVLEGREIQPDLVGQHRQLDHGFGLIARGSDEDAELEISHANDASRYFVHLN